MRRITLLTDFGTADGYVAAMKGVIADICPDAVMDDASHDLRQGDVEAAAWALAAYWRLYPAGTVHLIVVDPGVGSDRRALAVQADGRFLVAPDNGLLTPVLDAAERVEAMHALESVEHRRAQVSQTFHGRDVFAPAAAHLAAGLPIERLGAAVQEPVRLEFSSPVVSEGVVLGRVVHVDRFGNLVTDIPADRLPPGATVHVAGRSVGAVRGTYADVERGLPLALIGSSGQLEIAVRDGNAAGVLGVGKGTGVKVGLGIN